MKETSTLHSFEDKAIALYEQTITFCKNGKEAQPTTEAMLAILSYYMNLYSINPTPKLLDQLRTLMTYYYDYAQKREGDYSLATGKSGFLYAATRLHQIDNSTSFLEKAIALVEDGMENFIHSPYSNNAIATGRSGCLLVLNYYYTVTKDAKVQNWMQAILQKIIAQAQLSDKGVYWQDRFEKLNGFLDFDHGNAGIGFVMLLIEGRHGANDFQALAQQVYHHQTQYWDDQLGWKKTKKGIHNLSSYQEAIKAIEGNNKAFFEASLNDISVHVGITNFVLQLWNKLQDDSFKLDANKYLTACKELFLKSKPSVEEALQLGHLFLQAAQILQDQQYITEALTVADYIKKENSITLGHDFQSCVLSAKIAHFHLALEHPSVDQSVIAHCTQSIQLTPENASKIELKESLLQNTFHRTFSMLQSIDSEFLKDYLQQKIQTKEALNFMLFLKKQLHRFTPTQKKQLSEILKLEISIYNLKKGIQHYALLEAKDIYRYQSIQALFNTSDDNLATTLVQLNPKSKKIMTNWNWEIKQGTFSIDHLSSKASTVFLIPNYKNLVTEYWQHTHNVVLNHFQHQKSIAEAIAQLKQFYLAQDEIFMDQFAQFIMAERTYVLAQLDTIILNLIKEYMVVGLLEVVKDTI